MPDNCVWMSAHNEVPEMRPVEEFTVRPAGSPVALKLVGVLFAVML